MKPKLIKPMFLFVGICMLSLLVNINLLTISEIGASLLYLIRFIVFLVLYFVVLDLDKKFLSKVPYIMALAGFIVLIIGYIQYFFYPSLRNLFYLGWDEHLYRMFSSFFDPNFAGAFFSLYLFLIFNLIQENLRKRQKYMAAIFGILGFFTFTAIFLTYSRSAILMLFTGLIIYSVLKRKLYIVFVFTFVVLASIILSPKAFRTEGTNLLRKVSSEARITSAKEAISIFSKNPIFGVGFNAYKFARLRYGFSDFKFYPSHAEGGTDISFLFVLATTGILGLASYIFLLFEIIKLAYSKYKKNFIALVLLISIVSLMVNSLFINSLFYSFFMFWIWILVGLTENE